MCFEGLKAGRPRLLKILRIRRSCMSFGTFEDFEEILLRARSARHLTACMGRTCLDTFEHFELGESCGNVLTFL